MSNFIQVQDWMNSPYMAHRLGRKGMNRRSTSWRRGDGSDWGVDGFVDGVGMVVEGFADFAYDILVGKVCDVLVGEGEGVVYVLQVLVTVIVVVVTVSSVERISWVSAVIKLNIC